LNEPKKSTFAYNSDRSGVIEKRKNIFFRKRKS